MKKPRLWYVITDGGRARFVERDEEGAFRTLSSFVSTELHKSAHELGLTEVVLTEHGNTGLVDGMARWFAASSPTQRGLQHRRV